jgi:hypothetical protein
MKFSSGKNMAHWVLNFISYIVAGYEHPFIHVVFILVIIMCSFLMGKLIKA